MRPGSSRHGELAITDIARYPRGIAGSPDPAARRSRAAELLLKAVRSLPEGEQETVLTHLLERTLGGSGDEWKQPIGVSPPRSAFPELSVPPGIVQGLGSVAAGLLLGAKGVTEVATLCGVSEDKVRAVLREAGSDQTTPPAMARYLRLLAEGQSCTQARRRLKLTRRELDAMRKDAAGRKFETKLGRLLLIESHRRDTLRTLVAHNPMSVGPPGRSPAPSPTVSPDLSVVPPHDAIRQLLIAGQTVEQIAETCEIRVDAVRAALHTVADHPAATEPFASILRLIGDGRSRADVASELEISQEELTAALDPLRSSELQKKMAHAFRALGEARPLVGAPGGTPRTEMVGAGALGTGAHQMVPVRFPEAQHQRLKTWCATHGFSMAVVVRGLVERFLDEQERRAA
jgi:hypothetical protein